MLPCCWGEEIFQPGKMKKNVVNVTPSKLKKIIETSNSGVQIHLKDCKKLLTEKFIYVLTFHELYEQLPFEKREATKNFKTGNPAEQTLFKEVWTENEHCKQHNIHFIAYCTFKKINNELKLIDDNLITKNNFSHSPLYNRYRQFRLRKKKLLKKNHSVFE